mmetsp:Transcript_14862/g.21017  ORF Transcript_14862/g.21017 Transcript_14862/m.21017 type:complete len:82 (-) Transcript_14862:222-467(-)
MLVLQPLLLRVALIINMPWLLVARAYELLVYRNRARTRACADGQSVAYDTRTKEASGQHQHLSISSWGCIPELLQRLDGDD